MPAVARKHLPEDVRSEDVQHFSNIPLAKPTLDDAAFEIVSPAQYVTLKGTNHTLMTHTWNTPDTIPHTLAFYRPQAGHESGPTGTESTRAECRRLFTFGHMLNALPDTLHGGVLATLLDSTMGYVLRGAVNDGVLRYTVQLNVSYKAPVKTPGTVVARSWINKIEDGGRKIWIEGVVEGGDDGKVVHASAVALWLAARRKPEKL